MCDFFLLYGMIIVGSMVGFIFLYIPGIVIGIAWSPAIYLLIHWIEKKFGVHFAKGGTGAIVQGMVELLSDLDCIWHFIGSIQSNKCRDIATNFDWVHSVDRLKIARRLSDLRPTSAKPLNIFLQVNLQDEMTKSGTTSGELTALASAVSQLPNLKLRGLMAIPAPELNFEQQRKIFSKLREQKNRLNRVLNLALDCLSMGMTDDLEAAVAEGSTHVRIGTAIFGPKDPHK